MKRRHFIASSARALAAGALSAPLASLVAQESGERPQQSKEVQVLNPRHRVPVGLIIDDSTCLVNLNRFAMPQFDLAHGGSNPVYHKPWREWPAEIPDAFVRKFGEWCAEQGVKGKYSVVPFPACVGRLDRVLPGWSHREVAESIKLVRTLMMPNWDIHPEMVTHTRVIDLKTGHPYPDPGPKYMENWDWTTGRSADEIADYMAYALRILKNVELSCEGITTPGGFGNRARPQLAQASFESVRDVFGAEVPHYFRDLYDRGDRSVAPLVQNARGLDGPNPQCVVSMLGCTGDWTGGWDCVTPAGADRFITADLQQGRMVDVIQREEPAIMVCHWTGIYWNGQELGFKIFQEVVRRLHARFDNLIWMKLSEVARYWAARELTQVERNGRAVRIQAPFACPDFTVRVPAPGGAKAEPLLHVNQKALPLREVNGPLRLTSGSWCRDGQSLIVCFGLPKGLSRLQT